MKATVKGSQTEVGESANTVTAVSVFNAEQVDVTDYYKIRVVDSDDYVRRLHGRRSMAYV